MGDKTSPDSLLDILELIDRIERQTAGLTREEFLKNADIQDATAYRILSIGEAVKALDQDLTARHPTIPRAADHQHAQFSGA